MRLRTRAPGIRPGRPRVERRPRRRERGKARRPSPLRSSVPTTTERFIRSVVVPLWFEALETGSIANT